MQRWGSEQASSAVLLRTAALMSLASLGTAGLVLCGALGVGGQGGAGFAGALGTGPSVLEPHAPEQPTAVLAAPSASGDRAAVTAEAEVPARPLLAVRREAAPTVPAPAGTATPLSGTTSSAARTDLDSVVQPARGRVALPAVGLVPPSPSPSTTPTVESGAQPGGPDEALPALRTTAAEPVAPQPQRTTSPRRGPMAARPAQAPDPLLPVRAPATAPASRASEPTRAPTAATPVQAPKAATPVQAPKAATPVQAPKAATPVPPKTAKAPKAATPVPPKTAKAPKAPKALEPDQAAESARPAVTAQQSASADGERSHPHGGPPGQAGDKGPKH